MSIDEEFLRNLTKDMPYPDGLTDEECREKLSVFTQVDEAKDVTFAFKSLGIEQYTEAFVDYGYDDTTIFKALSAEDLEEVMDEAKMKPGHRLKLKAWIDGQLVVTGEDEYVTITRYGGEFIKAVGANHPEAANAVNPLAPKDKAASAAMTPLFVGFYGAPNNYEQGKNQLKALTDGVEALGMSTFVPPSSCDMEQPRPTTYQDWQARLVALIEAAAASPDQPIILCAFSYGAHAAYAVAEALESSGRVRKLYAIGCRAPHILPGVADEVWGVSSREEYLAMTPEQKARGDAWNGKKMEYIGNKVLDFMGKQKGEPQKWIKELQAQTVRMYAEGVEPRCVLLLSHLASRACVV